jgi:integrase
MTNNFESKFAPYIVGLIEQRRANGFKYESGEKLLKRFDKFCITHFPLLDTVTFELAAEWASSSPGQSDGYRNNKISVVKSLSIYMLSLGKAAYVPNTLTVKAYRPALYIPAKEEVRALLTIMEVPTSHNKTQRRLNKECRILFLLYYCCGLRLSEGRLLKRENVDLDTGTITIIGSKGQKDRLVYLPHDGIDIIREYIDFIETAAPNIPWVFPGFGIDKPISCSGVESCFNRYWKKLPVAKTLEKQPTPHCLRHAFVVDRINEWMLDGIDTNKMIPYLSRYLGHKSPDETFYYYHLARKAFDVILQKDSVSKRVIPEVSPYEE